MVISIHSEDFIDFETLLFNIVVPEIYDGFNLTIKIIETGFEYYYKVIKVFNSYMFVTI